MAVANLNFPRFRAFDSSGAPLNGGTVTVYEAGTTTKTTIWNDKDKTATISNPVTLDANGEAEIWFEGPVKVVLADSAGNQQWTIDDVPSDIPPSDVGRFNQLENGSFEIDANGDDLPDDWVITEDASDSTVEIDTSDVSHGANSLKFVSQGSGGGTATTSQFFEVNAGKTCVVVFTIKSSVADVQNQVQVRFFDKGQTFVSSATVYNENTNNPTSFEEKRFVASVPATATYAKLRLVGCDPSDSTPGTTFYDDIKVFTDQQAAVYGSGTGIVEFQGSQTVALDFQDDWTFSGTGGDVTASAADINNIVQAGIVQMYAGSSEPSGWLFCSGQAVSRTTFSDLFDVIGTTFGNGDGSTTFNVPDLRDRSPLGENTMGASDAGRVGTDTTALGDSGGSDTHTLTTSEMPSHNHGGSTGGNTAAGLQVRDNDGAVTADNVDVAVNNANSGTWRSGPIRDNSNHSHSISSQGGGSAHNTMHPFLVLNFIIKT